MKATNYAQALYSAISETDSKDHDKVLDNFVRILSQSGDAAIIEEIEKEYLRIEREAKGITEVTVTTATKQDVKELIKNLNQLAKEKIEVKTNIDEGIVGGVVVRAGDTLIDASVRRSLEDLKKTIEQ